MFSAKDVAGTAICETSRIVITVPSPSWTERPAFDVILVGALEIQDAGAGVIELTTCGGSIGQLGKLDPSLNVRPMCKLPWSEEGDQAAAPGILNGRFCEQILSGRGILATMDILAR
jgi:hypothetical protein